MDLDLLKKTSFMSDLDDETFKGLAEKMTEHNYKRGQVIFHEADRGDQLYFVVSGKVKLGCASADGREGLLAIISNGEIFGEMALFDPAPRAATATAVSATIVASLSHDDLRQALDDNPGLSLKLLQILAHRIRRTNDSLNDLVFSDVPGRVARAIIDLSGRFGRPVTDGLLVQHELTQEELAQLVGASRETVNKALAEFIHRGWIRLEARSVMILDMPRLEARSR